MYLVLAADATIRGKEDPAFPERICLGMSVFAAFSPFLDKKTINQFLLVCS